MAAKVDTTEKMEQGVAGHQILSRLVKTRRCCNGTETVEMVEMEVPLELLEMSLTRGHSQLHKDKNLASQ
jgi:hypothetical protein